MLVPISFVVFLFLSPTVIGEADRPSARPAVALATPAAPAIIGQDDLRKEYETRRKAAGKDAEKLWSVANWCEANGLTKQFQSCLRAIVKIDDGDKKAHELLGHIFYDDQWFTTEKKLEAYKKKREAELRKQEVRRAKELGLVKHGDQWVRPEEVEFLEKGFVKDESGAWIDPEEQKKLAEGWVKQDLEWVSPDEKDNIERGLWKCGDEWLSLEEANSYHADVATSWKIPGQNFVVYSTCERSVAKKALVEAEDAYSDLVRIFGTYPATRPHLLVLKSRDQYSSFAGGDPANQRMGAESQGLSSVHGAFFADLWFDIEAKKFIGAGVSYWDAGDEADAPFGRFWARHAAGQSFVEQIDSSPETLRKLSEALEAGGFSFEGFWDEKYLSPWFRYGAAAYVERYFVDKSASAVGNPYQIREWSVGNIARVGGLDPLDSIFEFNITVEDPEASKKLINEVGLLMAFLVDGECEPLQKAHEALKAAIKKARRDPKYRKDVLKAVQKIEKVLKSKSKELRAFAKL